MPFLQVSKLNMPFCPAHWYFTHCLHLHYYLWWWWR